jgi:hypothetical protein
MVKVQRRLGGRDEKIKRYVSEAGYAGYEISRVF